MKAIAYPCTEISKIDVNCKIYKIRVVESPNENIEISWNDTVMRSLEIRQDGDQLFILDHASIGIYGTLALINLKKDCQLLIKLPSAYFGKAIFQSKEEPVHISNLTTHATIGIAVNTGEILVEHVCCSHMDIRGNLGKINCYSLDATDTILISSKSGAIMCSLTGDKTEYTVSCTTNNRLCTSNGISGNGSTKVVLCSEWGNIRYTFQNNIDSIRLNGRYDRHHSFKEW